MRRIFQWIILISGIGLLLMTAMVAMVREDEPLQWMIYEDQAYVYWLHPDSSHERRMLAISQSSVRRWTYYNSQLYFLLETQTERNNINFTNSHLFRSDRDGTNLEILSKDIDDGVEAFWFIDDRFLVVQTWRLIGPPEIYISALDSETTQWENLTKSPTAVDLYTPISLDGEWFYYMSQLENERDEWGIFRIKVNATERELLVTNSDHFSFVDLSLGGKWLWYTRNIDENTQQLYRLSLIDDTEEQLSNMNIVRPVGWSANNEWFIFIASNVNGEGLYAISEDGADLVTFYASIDPQNSLIRLSPDKTIIMLTSCLDEGCDGDIFSINIEDRTVTQLTNTDTTEHFVGWSPDGQQVIYAVLTPSAYTFDRQYFAANADAQNAFPLAPIEDQASFPIWSPDNEWIIFSASSGNDTRALFRVRSDGTERQQLTSTREGVIPHIWSTTDVAWSKFQSFGVGLGLVIGSLGLKFGRLRQK